MEVASRCRYLIVLSDLKHLGNHCEMQDTVNYSIWPLAGSSRAYLLFFVFVFIIVKQSISFVHFLIRCSRQKYKGKFKWACEVVRRCGCENS